MRISFEARKYIPGSLRNIYLQFCHKDFVIKLTYGGGDVKISTKVLMGSLMASVIALILGIVGIVSIEKLSKFSSDLANKELSKLRTNAVISRGIAYIDSEANCLVYTTDEKEREHSYESIEENMKKVKEKFKELDMMDLSQKEKEVWDSLKPVVKEWIDKMENYLEKMKRFDEMRILDPNYVIENTYKLGDSLFAYARNLLKYIDGAVKEFNGEIDAEKCPFGKWISSYKPQNDELKKLLSEISPLHEKVHEGAQKIVKLVEKGDRESAMKVFQDLVIPNVEKINEMLVNVRNIVRKALERRQKALTVLSDLDELKHSMEKLFTIFGELIDDVSSSKAKSLVKVSKASVITMFGAMIAGIAMAVILGVVISRSVTNKMKDIVNFIELFSKGDLTVRFDVSGNDEIAVMGKALSKMAEDLRKDMKIIQKTSLELSSFSKDLDDFLDKQEASIDEMAQNIERVSQGAQSTSAAVEEITSGVQEVASSAQNLSNMSQQLTDAASDMSKSADEGKASIENVINLIMSVAEKTDNASRIVNHVAKESQNIVEIVETINSIAEQTNLLALNAAIEAARAGEAGRGFAIVADEIRKLAEESKRATENIDKILTEIQEGVMKTQGAMKEMVESVDKTSERAKGAMEKFERILDKIEDVMSLTEKFVATAQEQGAASEEIASAMSSASESVMEITNRISSLEEEMKIISDQSEDLGKAGDKLKDMAQSLAELVKKFKV